MKSFLIRGVKRLGSLLWRLLLSLKNLFLKVVKTRKLRNRVGMIVVLLLTWVWGVQYGAKHVEIPELEPEKEIVTIYVTPDPEMTAMMNQYQQQKTEREQNLTLISKVLYGYRDNSELDLEGVVWIILNRVDNQSEFRNFNTISQVCRQPHQWMGYNDTNPVLDNLYAIADKVLTKYETDGTRLFGQEYLYFEWSSEYILFKTELYDSRTCKKWRAY